MLGLARIVMLESKEAFYDAGHVKQWTPGSMRQCLVAEGFKIKQVRDMPFFFWPISLDCMLAASKDGTV